MKIDEFIERLKDDVKKIMEEYEEEENDCLHQKTYYKNQKCKTVEDWSIRAAHNRYAKFAVKRILDGLENIIVVEMK